MTTNNELNSLIDRMKKEIDLFLENPREDKIYAMYKIYDKILDYYEKNDVKLSELYMYLYDTGYLSISDYYLEASYNKVPSSNVIGDNTDYKILSKILRDYKEDNPSEYLSRIVYKTYPQTEEAYEILVEEIAGVIIGEASPAYFYKKMQKLLERGYLTESDKRELEKFKGVLELYKSHGVVRKRPPKVFYKYRSEIAKSVYKDGIKEDIYFFGGLALVLAAVEGGLHYAYTHLSSHPTIQEGIKYLGYGIFGAYGLFLIMLELSNFMFWREHKKWEEKYRRALKYE